MSLRAMAWAWEQNTKSSGERLVLLALADHAGDDGECYPHTARLAEKCALDRKTVQRHLIALDERGLVEKLYRRKRGDGRLAGWQYRIAFDDREGTPTSPHEGTPTSPREGTPTSRLEGTSMPPLEPSISNPQNEPSISNAVEIIDDTWEQFWNTYPRRTGKANARRAWDKLSATDRTTALDALTDHVGYWKAAGTQPQFIPHPATWINGRRWEDELPDTPNTTRREAPGMNMIRRLLEGNDDT